MDFAGFNDLLNAPVRMRICAILNNTSSVEFSFIRDTLKVSDSMLSKHLKTLADAGYVQLAKPTGKGGHMRTWVSLTRPGRKAFTAHVQALHQMIATTEAETQNRTG